MIAGRYRASVIAALASAGLLWAASPAVGLGALAWIALAPAAAAAIALPGRPGRLAVPLALAIFMETQLVPALPFGLAEGQWGDVPAPLMIDDSPVIAVALVAIPLYAFLLYLLPLHPRPEQGGSSVGGWRLIGKVRESGVLVVVLPALILAAVELVRSAYGPGGLWGGLALTQAGSVGAAPAAIAGPSLVALLIVAVNYSLALAFVRRRPKPALWAGGAAVAAMALGALATPNPGPGSIRVAAIQPGYDTAEEEPAALRRWQPGSYRLAAVDVVGDLAGPTEAAARDGAELVVWPEATAFVEPADHAIVGRLAGRLAQANEVAIVYPYFDYDRSRSGVRIARSDGSLSGPRPKNRPMWFLGERTIEAEPGLLTAGGVEVGVLLGVDAQDAGVAAGLVGDGADLIVSATHDWEQMATQQLAQAQLTATATGAPISRADWRYSSALIDRKGDPQSVAAEGKRRETLVADLATAGPTPYANVGNGPAWIVTAALVLFLIGSRATKRRRARAERAGYPCGLAIFT